MGKVKTSARKLSRKRQRGGSDRLLGRITVSPEVLAGKPTIRGMRISVELLLRLLADGMTHQEILHEYPMLVEEDIRAALQFAHHVVSQEKVYRLA